MGQVIGLRKGRAGGTGQKDGPFEIHIASLIGELEALLVERRSLGQGEHDVDPRTVSAGPFATPYNAAPTAVQPTGFPEARARLARSLIRQRRLRSDFLPATLFAEPAWDMLLDLYAACYEGKPVAVSSLCIAANVPSTTALRNIDAMTRAGCLERRRDPKDARRIFVTLSESARAGLDAWFDAIAV
jgi:DNA-binding MarR family transcriptional regulator